MTLASNQNGEQIARDLIDAKLAEAGWQVQSRTAINFGAGPGIAVREYQTDVGPADYVLFLNKSAVAIKKLRVAGTNSCPSTTRQGRAPMRPIEQSVRLAQGRVTSE
jgi:hypothetical protein